MRVCDGVREHLGVLFQLRGSVVPKAFFVALPSAVISVLITSVAGWREEFQMFVEQNRPQTWLAVAAVVSLLVGFRSEQAWARMWEGTDLIHRMRGEWFDAFSCLFVFTRSAKKDSLEEVQQFRQTLLRLASMLHGCAMFEIANHDRIDADIDIIDFRGLDHETILHLRLCNANGFNKFEAILHMIYCLVTENHEKKVISCAPPILSRCFQEFSRGMVHMHNAKKITDTKFPYPYAQLIGVFLTAHTVLTPMIVAAYIEVTWWAALVSFIWVFGVHGANFIASELEMPFSHGPNDLPLEMFHKQMNDSLLMLSHEASDLLPKANPEMKRDWYQLASLDVIDLNTFIKDHSQEYGAVRHKHELEEQEDEKFNHMFDLPTAADFNMPNLPHLNLPSNLQHLPNLSNLPSNFSHLPNLSPLPANFPHLPNLNLPSLANLPSGSMAAALAMAMDPTAPAPSASGFSADAAEIVELAEEGHSAAAPAAAAPAIAVPTG